MELKSMKNADVWQMTRVLKRFNLKEAFSELDSDMVRKSRFKAPTKFEGGKEVPLPEEEWTRGQKKARDDAKEANDALLWQIVGVIMEHIGDCEDDVNKLLAISTGESLQAIRDLSAQETIELIVQYITREDFADFFTFALNLLNRQKASRKSIISAVTSIK